MSSVREFQYLKISLDDIKSATKDFPDCIGEGGFGKVYKGTLRLSTGLTTMVAIKKLDSSVGQGVPEFWREIMLLTRYKHENLVSLLGFCDEGGEKILVYEYLPNKSLDLYLSSTTLSWNQRLRICIGAAHGLQYLHKPFEGSQQRVLHRDIKSGNILLDQNWEAKIADFGLSKFGPANQEHTFLYSTAVGTMGYCDPLYMQNGQLTKESDVYSFGAVLFEVICGRPCVQKYTNGLSFLTELARKRYEEKKLDTIIHNNLKGQISPLCLERFSKIAYQCLRIDHTQRPLMSEVVKELEIALQLQEEYEFEKKNELKRSMVSEESESDEYWEAKLPRDWEVIIKKLKIPNTVYAKKRELFSLLQKGIFFYGGKKFFWINDDGKICEAISSEICIDFEGGKYFPLKPDSDSRFPLVVGYSRFTLQRVKFEIKTSMLSLGTMYEARLVLKPFEMPFARTTKKFIEIKWRTNGLNFFWINDDGKICEAISSEICIDFEGHRFFFSFMPDSHLRFPFLVGYYDFTLEGVKFEIKTSMLSLGTMYEASLVFKFLDMSFARRSNKFIEIKWRMNGLNVCSIQYPQLTSNNWFTIKMWHFINPGPNTDFDIYIEGLSYSKESGFHRGAFFQGIEFQPIEMHEDIEGFKSLLISDEVAINEDDGDEYWEKKLPDGYGVLIKMSDKPSEYTTKKELYLSLCEGFLCNNGRMWVSLCKSIRGICSILRAANDSRALAYKSLTLPLIGSRFNKVAKLKRRIYSIYDHLYSHMFSPQYVYACYLLFKFEHEYIASSGNCLFKVLNCNIDGIPASKLWNMPTIKPNNDYGSNDSSNITEGHIEHDINGKIKQRKDGWMEVILCNSLRHLQHHESIYITIEVSEDLISSGMIIEGVEFRPRIQCLQNQLINYLP